ncbi:MAG: hypothetical protein LC631_03935, partial [Desulfovibrionales bacterium]|nr:hypothetical protein [Desulfovibrionales bacterium]
TLHWLDKHADIAPQDSQTMAIRSWALYHLQKYDQALDIFSKQLLLFPDNEKALLGKIYSLQASGRHQEALSVLESWEEELSAELQGVLGSLYCTIGNDEYSAGNVDQALVYLEQCVERNPDAREVEVLGWNLLETGDSKAAHSYFLKAYGQQPSQDNAQAVLISARELENRAYFWKLLKDMADHENPEVRTAAADAYAREECPILAAGTHPDSGQDTCYMNSDTDWMNIGVHYRNVSGDRGTSKLQDISVPMEYHRPVSRGGKWTLRITPHLLNSGKHAQDAYTGSYYNFLDQGKSHQTHEDKVWVAAPEIEYQREGRYRLAVRFNLFLFFV